MKPGMMLVAIGLIACVSVAWAKPHTAADTNFLAVAGGSTCPTGTTQVHTGTSVIFENPKNGNLTEDARCWQTVPASTSDVVVVVLGSCVVCRFGP
jgi:hypothetical protein